MAAHDPETRDHRDWLKLLQEESAGLVVAAPAMTRAEAIVPRNSVELHRRYLAAIAPSRAELDAAGPRRRGHGFAGEEERPAQLDDFPRLARDFLGWEPEDLVGGPTPEGRVALPPSLEIALTEYQQVLAPTWAVPAPDAPADASPVDPRRWLMLIVEVDGEFDDAGAELPRGRNRGWHASPQNRLERLLHDTGVPIGLLVNHRAIRLVYAPGGESSGYLTFPIAAMAKSDARLILGAFHMLLGAERLFTLPDDRRLPSLLAESRKYQSEVSTRLSEQVLRALGELLRGFVAADDAAGGALLGEAARLDPQHIYGGLLTALMRLVFLLYAEERGLMPQEAPYSEHYAVTSLFERLRADAGLYIDTMDQRYGAWARLLSLFRLVHDGGAHGPMRLPARRGELFNPDTYAFLEGRPYRTLRVLGERITPPRIADGVVYRVLEDLLLLGGERLSYRTLDVEQIGSVYEAIMGFEVRRAFAPSIALRPDHVVIDLAAILAAKPAERAGLLEAQAACKVPRGAAEALKQATTIDALVAALGSRVSPQTPNPLAAGALYLQPTEERRRSGSHYTPRALTEPIVATTLRPVLEALGDRPTPEQILDLKVCDPAMGSGAFLVETCRRLGKALVAAWAAHDATPTAIPPDEDVTLHARRLIAQRCLYGVDKNPFAVSLAKLSLWLVTLAKDHPFTFIDHALRHGDSLVGLTRQQIAGFHWIDDNDLPLFRWVADQIGKARSARDGIILLGDEQEDEKRLHWREAEEALEDARLTGDLVISAFFAAAKDKDRLARLAELRDAVDLWRKTGDGADELKSIVEEMRSGERPVVPLHWEIEFPEVFDRRCWGFSAFVGNPPFGGKNTLAASHHERHLAWLKHLAQGSHGNSDLVAYFFRRAFNMASVGGCLGFLATNTIRQGDTRSTGIAPIVREGGIIYGARRRVRWPGKAAVIVSVIHISKLNDVARKSLDSEPAEKITSYLVDKGGDDEPVRLKCNQGRCFQGTIVLGMGFTFDDSDAKGVASPISVMHDILNREPRSKEAIFPFIGYAEVANDVLHRHARYVINFGDHSEADARSRWPLLMAVVEAKVRPVREAKQKTSIDRRRAKFWWQYGSPAKELYRAIEQQQKVIVTSSQAAAHLAFAMLPAKQIFSSNLNVFAADSLSFFCIVQARTHEVWARFFGSTMKDDISYTPTTCFETFPFPLNAEDPPLAGAGESYYTYRADLMLGNKEGLTDTYNRFHNPDETDPKIFRLRELHDEMDRVVLAAYGWSDLDPRCEFLLDYEDDADDDDGSRRKKPWRYRWPDAFQEEVLARLLALNQERAEEERLAGLGMGKGAKAKPAKSDPKPPAASSDTAAARRPAPATATSVREPTSKANASAKKKAKKKATKKADRRSATTGQADLFSKDDK